MGLSTWKTYQFPIKELYCHNNRFTGTISLKKLPESLVELTVDNNELSGTIDVTSLPVFMMRLSLGNNNFDGMTDFSNLPEYLSQFDVTNTNLSGEVYEFEGTHLGVEKSNVKDMRKES